jgi:hypothetical protein
MFLVHGTYLVTVSSNAMGMDCREGGNDGMLERSLRIAVGVRSIICYVQKKAVIECLRV